MWQMLGVKDNQGAQRKLSRYGVRFFVNGWGKNASFNITAIDDPFKVYCILEMGFDANCDFKKLRNYLFFLLGEDEYAGFLMSRWKSICGVRASTSPVKPSPNTVSIWSA